MQMTMGRILWLSITPTKKVLLGGLPHPRGRAENYRLSRLEEGFRGEHYNPGTFAIERSYGT